MRVDPATRLVIIIVNEIVNASIAAAAMAAEIRQGHAKAANSVAPRSCAASSSAGSNPRKRASTTTTA